MAVEIGTRPFLGNFRFLDADYNGRFKSLEQNPNIIIKHSAWPNKNNLEQTVNTLSAANILYQELKEGYQINVPNFQFIVGQNEYYSVIEKLEGENITQLSPLALPQVAPEMDDFILKFCKYYWDKFNNGLPYLLDVHLGQIMYGKTQNRMITHFIL